jgi:hypothetical protein
LGGGGGACHSKLFFGLKRYLLFLFCVSDFNGKFSPTIQEPSKDKKTLSRKKALGIVLFGDMGYLIFHLNKKT